MSEATAASQVFPELDGLQALVADRQIDRKELFQRLLPILVKTQASEPFVAAFGLLTETAWKLPLPKGMTLDEKSESSLQQRLARPGDPDSGVRAAVVMFLLDTIGRGLDGAYLNLILNKYWAVGWEMPAVNYFWRLLQSGRLLLSVSKGARSQLTAELKMRLQQGNFGKVVQGLRFAGLNSEVDVIARTPAFQEIFLPIYRDACAQRLYPYALLLENFVYDAHIKRTETPEHYEACWSALASLAYALGKDMLATRPAKTGDPIYSGRPKVAFLVHNTALLAHTGLLLAFLRGLRSFERAGNQAGIVPLVYAIDGAPTSQLRDEVEALDVDFIFGPAVMPDPAINIRLGAAKAHFEKLGVSEVVFISLPIYMAFACGIRLAPKITWWSMKFPLASFPMLDGRVQCFSLYKQAGVLDGQVWHFGPQPQEPQGIAPASEIEAVRHKYAGFTILGTISREEKINHPDYLRAVTEILKKYPATCFLWTGRTALPSITAAFTAAGVADRCHFIGWVDPKVYCSVFDLYLDTFPLSGIMPNQAMFAGVAVVSGGYNGAYNYLAPAPDGSLPYTTEQKQELDEIFGATQVRAGRLWGDTVEEYVALACRLIEDTDLRQDFAEAGKRFAARFRYNPGYAAGVLAEQFAEIASWTVPGTS